MFRVVVSVLLVLLAAESAASIHMSIVRAAFPFADNGWADHAQFAALYRMAHGGIAYTPPIDRNSYIYGPLYLWTIDGVRGLFGWAPGIVTLRAISMAVGVLALVPLLLVTAILAPLAGIERRFGPAYVLGLVATAAAGVCTIAHDLTYDTLHPDALLFLIAAATLALYFAFARWSLPEPLLAAFVPLAVLDFLTKSSAIAFVPVLLFALFLARRVSLRAALLVAAATVGATLAAVAALPNDMKVWTLVVPASQPIQVWRSYQFLIDAFGTRDNVYVFFIGAMIAAAAITGYAIRERSGRRWGTLVAGSVVAAVLTGFPAYLKQGGTWNNLVLIAVCCVPFTGLLAALPFRREALPRGLAYAGTGVLGLAILSFALSNKQLPLDGDVRHLTEARSFLARLCREHPHDTLYATLFPDLLAGCPNSLFHSQYALGELTWAEPKYSIGVPVDADPKVRYVAYVDSPHFGTPVWLRAKYRPIHSSPVIVGEWYIQYDHVNLIVYERLANR